MRENIRLIISCTVPLLSMSRVKISGCIFIDSDPPQSPETRMSRVTFAGKLSASSCATEAPMEKPMILAGEMPRASISVAVSWASTGMENDVSDPPEYPVPRLSKMMTRKCREIFSRTGGFHMSIVDPNPLMKTTGSPDPSSLYASVTSSTGTIFTGIRVTTRSCVTETNYFSLQRMVFPIK